MNGDFSAGLMVAAPVAETPVVEAVTSLMVGVRLGLKVASKNGRDDFFKTEQKGNKAVHTRHKSLLVDRKKN